MKAEWKEVVIGDLTTEKDGNMRSKKKVRKGVNSVLITDKDGKEKSKESLHYENNIK